MFEFDVSWVQLLQFGVAVVLPLLVGLVTTKVTNGSLKAVLLIILSFISGLALEILSAAEAGVVYDLGAGLLAGLTTLVIAIAIHYGVWKPVGATAAAQRALVKANGPEDDGSYSITNVDTPRDLH